MKLKKSMTVLIIAMMLGNSTSMNVLANEKQNKEYANNGEFLINEILNSTNFNDNNVSICTLIGDQTLLAYNCKNIKITNPQPNFISDVVVSCVIDVIPGKISKALAATTAYKIRDYNLKYPVLYCTVESYKSRGADGNIYYAIAVNHFTDPGHTNLVGNSYTSQRG